MTFAMGSPDVVGCVEIGAQTAVPLGTPVRRTGLRKGNARAALNAHFPVLLAARRRAPGHCGGAVTSAVSSGLMYLHGMIRPKVYVETTIPSAYFEVRTAATVVARREWTRKWWGTATERYELFTSPGVIAELVAGRSERGAERAALVQHLPLLPIGRPVLEIVQAYIRHKLMPADPGGDALHLALASYYKCDFLDTWNCQHLANANKFDHIRRINTLLGLYVPSLVTPLELLGVADEQSGTDQ